MAIYRLKIVGVHYAVNADCTLNAEETQEMHTRTATRLEELDAQRPPVLLMPEPSNPVDPRAVMARAQGARIGYVDKTLLDVVHALFKAQGGRPLKARICEVEARKHGWLFVEVQTEEEVLVEPTESLSDEWKGWRCTLPVMAPTEASYAREEAEVMLEEVLSMYAPETAEDSAKRRPLCSLHDLDWMEQYLRLWMENALHDLSDEARLAREHYIDVLKALQESAEGEMKPRIKSLLYELEKLRTAICGKKRMHLRIEKWWAQLVKSAEMERLWNLWMMHTDGDMEQGRQQIEALLKALPYNLYAMVPEQALFFSKLHYNHVPRTQFWQIVSVLLLRERTLMEMERGVEEGARESLPLPLKNQKEEEADDPFVVVIPPEFQSPEAKKILARLQKKGYLDEDLQPIGLSGAKKGVLAWEVADRLGIRNIWKLVGVLWKCNGETIRKERQKNIETDALIKFTKNIKAVIYSA